MYARERMGIIELDIVLAAPDDLHRLAGLSGEKRGLGDIIRLRFPSECSVGPGLGKTDRKGGPSHRWNN